MAGVRRHTLIRHYDKRTHTCTPKAQQSMPRRACSRHPARAITPSSAERIDSLVSHLHVRHVRSLRAKQLGHSCISLVSLAHRRNGGTNHTASGGAAVVPSLQELPPKNAKQILFRALRLSHTGLGGGRTPALCTPVIMSGVSVALGSNLGERRPALTSPSKSRIARGRSEVRVWGGMNGNCAA